MIIYQRESIPVITVKLNQGNGQPYDFTGATEIVVRFRSGARSVAKKLSLGEVFNIQAGQVSVGLTEDDTLSLPASEEADVRIRVTKPTEQRVAIVKGLRVRKS